jgi:hypothetical protein
VHTLDVSTHAAGATSNGCLTLKAQCVRCEITGEERLWRTVGDESGAREGGLGEKMVMVERKGQRVQSRPLNPRLVDPKKATRVRGACVPPKVCTRHKPT